LKLLKKTLFRSFVISTLLVIFFPLDMAFGEPNGGLSKEKKIDHLIAAVANSQATFLRNGDEHPAKKASAHLKFKYSRAKNMFWFFGPSKAISAREFIEKICTKSSSTGRPYQIRLSDKTVVPLGAWLTKELIKIEAPRMQAKK
jgi:hypothetical protein